MWKYPIKSDKSGYVSLKEAYQWCNMSFYDGFIAAFCESPEDYEAINTEDKITLVTLQLIRWGFLFIGNYEKIRNNPLTYSEQSAIIDTVIMIHKKVYTIQYTQ